MTYLITTWQRRFFFYQNNNIHFGSLPLQDMEIWNRFYTGGQERIRIPKTSNEVVFSLVIAYNSLLNLFGMACLSVDWLSYVWFSQRVCFWKAGKRRDLLFGSIALRVLLFCGLLFEILLLIISCLVQHGELLL